MLRGAASLPGTGTGKLSLPRELPAPKRPGGNPPARWDRRPHSEGSGPPARLGRGACALQGCILPGARRSPAPTSRAQRPCFAELQKPEGRCSVMWCPARWSRAPSAETRLSSGHTHAFAALSGDGGTAGSARSHAPAASSRVPRATDSGRLCSRLAQEPVSWREPILRAEHEATKKGSGTRGPRSTPWGPVSP